MNDKIKKLAEQAGCTYTMNNAITTKHNGLPIDVMEKFAELIVEECIEVVVKSDFSLKPILREPYKTIMNNIVEHFGIES
jgi:hypothetical protein